MEISTTPDPLRRQVLEEAGRLICGDRQTLYGEPFEHFTMVALVWSARLNFDIQPWQVPLLMADLKMCRLFSNPHDDGFVDLVGYGALAFEVAKHD
jgi:hypothetical protein